MFLTDNSENFSFQIYPCHSILRFETLFPIFHAQISIEHWRKITEKTLIISLYIINKFLRQFGIESSAVGGAGSGEWAVLRRHQGNMQPVWKLLTFRSRIGRSRSSMIRSSMIRRRRNTMTSSSLYVSRMTS